MLSDVARHGGHGEGVLHVAVRRVLGRDLIGIEVALVMAVQLIAELLAELCEETGVDQHLRAIVDTGFAL